MNRTRAAALALLILSLPLLGCAHAPGKEGAPPIVYVERDAEWNGDVRVDGIVHVRKGATLTIRPGARVLFGERTFPSSDEHEGFSGPGIRVEGSIVAVGTEEAPILFTSAARPLRPAAWDKILFTFSTGNRFEHCTFEGARYAFHSHFSEIAVKRCLFRQNEEGVRLGTSKVRIEESVFTRNEVRGINFRECRNEIRRNLIFDNGDGIFLHSKTAQSVIRENAIYANRGYNVRLGDLHADDADLSANWWGTARVQDATRKLYDGALLAGIGSIRLTPVLARAPISGAEVRGVFVFGRRPVAGGTVRAYTSIEDGFGGDGFAAESGTTDGGLFRLAVPPGRYYLVGRADAPEGTLFAFPGRNPVTVSLGETVEVGLPAVVAPPKGVVTAPVRRTSIVVAATHSGRPVAGVTVQAARLSTPDFRGPGEATALTDEEGKAALHLPPGRYILSARKRTTGAALGMVDEGGLFGVYPHAPVDLSPGQSVRVEIPLFEKRGLLGDERESSVPAPRATPIEGEATLSGRPAEGYLVYFYRPPETIGRPVARSSAVSRQGTFTVSLPGPGDYVTFLRKAVPGVPGGAEEDRMGPVPARVEDNRLIPSPIAFDGERR